MFSKLFDFQDLTSHLILSKVVRLLVHVLMLKISVNLNKICFIINSTTPLIKKKQTFQKKPKAVKDRGAGSRVGMTAVKVSMVFFKGFPK